jgi:hypothetical protein
MTIAEPKSPSELESLIVATITDAFHLGRDFEQVDPEQVDLASEALFARNEGYLRHVAELAELAGANPREIIEELVAFAGGLMQAMALSTDNDPVELLESLATWPRD